MERAPKIIPLILSPNELNTYVSAKKGTISHYFELKNKNEILYRVPPLVNNLTQKTHRNVFSIEEYG